MNYLIKKTDLYNDVLNEDYISYHSHFNLEKSNMLRDLNQEDLSIFGEDSPLLSAAISGDIQKILKFTKNKNRINLTNNKGFTALHWACVGRKLPIIEYLLSIGADVNAITERGETTLHWSVRSNNIKCTLAILNKINKNLIGYKNYQGFTALHFSASKGNYAIFIELLKQGADIYSTNRFNATVLHWATCCEGSETNSEKYIGKLKIAEEIISRLIGLPDSLKYFNRLNKIGKTALHRASLSGYSSVVEKLFEATCDPRLFLPPFPSAYEDFLNNKFNKKINQIYHERGII